LSDTTDTDPPRGDPPSSSEDPQGPGQRPSLTERLWQQDRRRPGGPTFWQWLRRTARLWGFLAFVFLILAIFRSVILPFLLALLAAYVLAPLVRFLSSLKLIGGRRLPRFAWVIVIYAVLLGLIGLFVTSFVPRLSSDMKRILAEAPGLMKKARTVYVPVVDAWVQANFGEPPKLLPKGQAPPPPPVPRLKLKKLPGGELEVDLSAVRLEVVKRDGRWLIQVPRTDEGEQRGKWTVGAYLGGFLTRSESQLNKVVGLGQRFIKGIFATITTFILVLMISAFLLVDTERILRWFRNLTPRIYHDDFDKVIKRIDKGLSGAIRGQFIICCINGLLTWIGLQVIGVKYPLLLGLLAGVMSLIPIFGSILSSIPIVLVALASGGEGISVIKGVLILLWIIAIHLLEANLLNPKIMGTAAKIHPVIVIFAVVAGERMYGPMGALLGVPLVTAVQAVFTYVRRKMRREADAEGKGDQTGKQQPAGADG
jgi:predicted PurR-regulated permease PerM